MPLEDFWRIEHAFSDGPGDALPIDEHAGPETTVAAGQDYSLAVWVSAASDSPAGAWPDVAERWRTLKSLGGPASATVVHTLPGDGPHQFTVVGKTAGVGGGLVTLHPPAGSQYGVGGHFACTAVAADRSVPDHFARVEMDLTRLADLGTGPGEFSARAAAREVLETPI